MVQPSLPIVVITGATSGIGRTLALRLACKRFRLGLAARNSEQLALLAQDCEKKGAAALIRAVDMRHAGEVEDLRSAAVAHFGGIDVWINCAANLVFGRFEEIPPEDFQRVLETNIIGYANGARAALGQFRSQGSRGTLINIGSMLGVVPEPYVSAYVASKFAIRGFTGCLRQKVREASNIHICTVLPAAIDTPIYQKAANYTGLEPRAIFPVYVPQRAADAIIRLIDRPRREIRIGGFAVALDLAVRLVPGLLEKLVGAVARKAQFQSLRAARHSGNLFHSRGPYDSSGGWRSYWKARLLAGRRKG